MTLKERSQNNHFFKWHKKLIFHKMSNKVLVIKRNYRAKQNKFINFKSPLNSSNTHNK